MCREAQCVLSGPLIAPGVGPMEERRHSLRKPLQGETTTDLRIQQYKTMRSTWFPGGANCGFYLVITKAVGIVTIVTLYVLCCICVSMIPSTSVYPQPSNYL